MPSSKEWLAIFSQALLETTYAYHYEQLNASDMTPEETAARAWEVYTAWLEAECGGGGCRQPGGARVYRTSPTTGNFEILEDEEWVEDESIPATPASPETEEYAATCRAATNAANSLHTIWAATVEISDAGYNAADALLDYGAIIGASLGAAFALPVTGFMGILQGAWELIYNTYQLITYEMWDEKFTETLKCLLLQNAVWDVSTGVVTFNFAQLRVDMISASFTGQAYLLQAAQVGFMLETIGRQGLDQLGAGPLDGECGCGEWCREWTYADFLASSWVMTEGIQNADGTFASTHYGTWPNERLDINITIPAAFAGSKIHAVDVQDTRGAGGWDDMISRQWVTPGTPANTYQSYYYRPMTWRTTWGAEAGAESGELPVVLRMSWNASGGPSVGVLSIRLRGTGRNPFMSEGRDCP